MATYRAKQPLKVGGALAYTTGDMVPESVAIFRGWITAGVVELVSGTPVDPGDGNGTPDPTPTVPSGQGIPSGGLTGQVLAKASGADYATQWITVTGGSGADPETVRDTIAAALRAGGNISVTTDDVADTITIAVTGVPAHSHTASQITDFTEAAQDVVGGLIKAGTNITLAYDDANNTFTINSTAGGGDSGTGTGTDAEIVRDTIAAALVAGTGVQITADDAADTITVRVTNLDASSITTGVLGVGRLGTGTPTGTSFLAGDGTWKVLQEVNPVRTVNNLSPDANGNINVTTSGGGGTSLSNMLFANQTSTGYALDDGSAVLTPLQGYRYWFTGLTDPPFYRANLDRWTKRDVGVVAAWALVSEDAFDDGLQLATPADVPLKAKWGGSANLYQQSAAGRLKPNGWSGTTSGNIVIVDSTVAAPVMAVDFTTSAYTNVAVRRPFFILVNVTAANQDATNVTCYSVGMTTDGTTMTWTCGRRDSAVLTAIGDTWTEPFVSAPLSYRVESNGAGEIKLFRGGVAVKTWTDPATTKITGSRAGLLIYNSAGSGLTASMAARGEDWKVYKR